MGKFLYFFQHLKLKHKFLLYFFSLYFGSLLLLVAVISIILSQNTTRNVEQQLQKITEGITLTVRQAARGRIE